MMIRIPLGLGVLLLSPLLSIAVEVSTGAPNVLFIAVDEWKPEVGTHGSAQIKTRDARRSAGRIRIGRRAASDPSVRIDCIHLP